MPPRKSTTPLRSVAPDEKPEPPAAESPKTVSQAASNGTTRELLVATRDRIAEAVENKNTAARDLAALTKRLFEVVRDIEAIDARAKQEGEEGSVAATPDEDFDEAAI